MKTYTLNVAGLKRELQICPLNDKLSIAAFIMFGDVELTSTCAKELLKLAPDHDLIITSESKGIPLAFEMARQSGNNNYIVARKSKKLYMNNVFSSTLTSITTVGQQTLYVDGKDAANMNNKRILIVDDVISTGESLKALEDLVNSAGGKIVGKMAVLAEGDAEDRDDISFLAPLPLFNKEGEEIK